MSICTFDLAWRGPCGKENCQEHASVKCDSCGEPATRECDQTGIQFVCGYPLCNNCEHKEPEPGKAGLFALGGGHGPKVKMSVEPTKGVQG